jgi:hypothetical protein
MAVEARVAVKWQRVAVKWQRVAVKWKAALVKRMKKAEQLKKKLLRRY